MKEKEERKIIKVSERRYQLLKLSEDKESWHEYGKNKSIKAISDLLKNERFALTISESLVYEIAFYQKEQEKKRREYLSKKGLEAKTI